MISHGLQTKTTINLRVEAWAWLLWFCFHVPQRTWHQYLYWDRFPYLLLGGNKVENRNPTEAQWAHLISKAITFFHSCSIGEVKHTQSKLCKPLKECLPSMKVQRPQSQLGPALQMNVALSLLKTKFKKNPTILLPSALLYGFASLQYLQRWLLQLWAAFAKLEESYCKEENTRVTQTASLKQIAESFCFHENNHIICMAGSSLRNFAQPNLE